MDGHIFSQNSCSDIVYSGVLAHSNYNEYNPKDTTQENIFPPFNNLRFQVKEQLCEYFVEKTANFCGIDLDNYDINKDKISLKNFINSQITNIITNPQEDSITEKQCITSCSDKENDSNALQIKTIGNCVSSESPLSCEFLPEISHLPCTYLSNAHENSFGFRPYSKENFKIENSQISLWIDSNIVSDSFQHLQPPPVKSDLLKDTDEFSFFEKNIFLNCGSDINKSKSDPSFSKLYDKESDVYSSLLNVSNLDINECSLSLNDLLDIKGSLKTEVAKISNENYSPRLRPKFNLEIDNSLEHPIKTVIKDSQTELSSKIYNEIDNFWQFFTEVNDENNSALQLSSGIKNEKDSSVELLKTPTWSHTLNVITPPTLEYDKLNREAKAKTKVFKEADDNEFFTEVNENNSALQLSSGISNEKDSSVQLLTKPTCSDTLNLITPQTLEYSSLGLLTTPTCSETLNVITPPTLEYDKFNREAIVKTKVFKEGEVVSVPDDNGYFAEVNEENNLALQLSSGISNEKDSSVQLLTAPTCSDTLNVITPQKLEYDEFNREAKAKTDVFKEEVVSVLDDNEFFTEVNEEYNLALQLSSGISNKKESSVGLITTPTCSDTSNLITPQTLEYSSLGLRTTQTCSDSLNVITPQTPKYDKFNREAEAKTDVFKEAVLAVPDDNEVLKETQEVKAYELPFKSNNEKENEDINDVRWDYLRKLNSDEERYITLRKCWKNVGVPDPNANLTYHAFRNRRRNRLLNCTGDPNIATTSRKRPREDDVEDSLPVSKRQRKFENLDFQFKSVRNTMVTLNRDYRLALDKYATCSQQTKRKLQRRYDEYKAQLRNCRSEAESIHKFYDGLPDQSFRSQEEIEEEQFDAEQVFNLFKKYYNWSGAVFNPGPL